MFDKCIEVRKPDENSQIRLTDKFEVVFNFEFLDDLYSIHTWRESKSSQRRREKLKEHSECLRMIYPRTFLRTRRLAE